MPRLVFSALKEEDLDDMIEVTARSRKDHPHERRLSRDEADGYTFRDPDFDPDGAWLVRLDGEPVGIGMAIIDRNRMRAGKPEGYFEVDVVPESRGVGVETGLLERSTSYLRRGGVKRVISRCPTVDRWRMSLLTSNSFTEYYRVFLLARRGPSEVPMSELPEGFQIERRMMADCTDDDIASAVGAMNESFVDHPRFVPESPERFLIWRDTHTDPTLISRACEGKTVVGLCVSEESRSFNKERGVSSGWINILGVSPRFRRRGLARAMIVDSVKWLADRGIDTVYIGVVSENDRALGLYLSLGFERDQETIHYQRMISD